MKIAVINFSGNTGKTTTSKHLLVPRIPGAELMAVESINADEGADGLVRGKEFTVLSEQIMLMDNVVVDVGASNVEDFMRLMKQNHGSHEDFDLFIIPAVKESKQLADTIATINALAAIGVESKKIRVVLNRVQVDEEITDVFWPLFQFQKDSQSFVLRPKAAIQYSELYERIQRIRPGNLTIPQILADPTDWKLTMVQAKTTEAKAEAASRVSLKRLAISAQANLDAVFNSIVTRY